MIEHEFNLKLIIFITFACNVNSAVFRNDFKKSTSTNNFLLELLDQQKQKLVVILDADVLASSTKDYDEEAIVNTGVKFSDQNADAESEDDGLEKNSKHWLHHILRTNDDDNQADNIENELHTALRKKCESLNKCKRKCPKEEKPCIKVCASLIDEDNLCDNEEEEEKEDECDTCGKQKCDKCGQKPACDKCGQKPACDKCGQKKTCNKCEKKEKKCGCASNFDEEWDDF